MKKILSNNYYRAIFENSYDAIFLTSPDGQIFHANPAACDMFQMTEDELRNKGRDGLADHSDPRFSKLIILRAKNRRLRYELTYKRKDGSVFPGDGTSILFKDDDGEDMSTVIIRDMTIFIQDEEASDPASIDCLTGLLVQEAFVDRMQEELSQAKKGTQNTIIIIDIDEFKKINENYGDQGGDIILKEFSKMLTDQLRPDDILGRYGNDEFIICLPGTSLDESIIIAESMRCLAEKTPILSDSNRINITASLGVACMASTEPVDIDFFISMAEKALYLAKARQNSVIALKA